MSEWISVNDQLPDDETTVLVYEPGAEEPVWLGYHEYNRWWSMEHGRLDVTHWMELPEPPESDHE